MFRLNPIPRLIDLDNDNETMNPAAADYVGRIIIRTGIRYR